MKGLRKIPRVSWSAKTTDEWVLNKAGVNRELSDTVKARKLACHTMRKQRSCLEKEIMQGTMPGAQRRGRPRTQTEGEHESSSRHNRCALWTFSVINATVAASLTFNSRRINERANLVRSKFSATVARHDILNNCSTRNPPLKVAPTTLAFFATSLTLTFEFDLHTDR